MRRALLALLAAVPPAAAADLAPGDPPLTQMLADLRRDAVEAVFEVQLTARQLREHQRRYAHAWTYSPPAWQRAEGASLQEFRGVWDKPAADRTALQAKHRAAWRADAETKAAAGNPYFRWLLAAVKEAAEPVADASPALRRDALANVLEFVQWALRMQLTVRQQEEFLRQVPADWAAVPQAERVKLLDESLPVYRKVVRLAPADREAVRKVAGPLLREMLAKPETPLDRWLAAAHAEAGRELAAGPPDALAAGGAAQHADWYDWALGVRLPDAARTAFRDSLAEDWKKYPDLRRGWLDTAALMDDPPAGGVGALRRLEDRAGLLFHICNDAGSPVNRAALAEYRKHHPGVVPPASIPVGATLVAGPVPLTEGLAEGACRCLEWALGVRFDATQRAEHRRHLLATWTSGKKSADDLRGWERDADLAAHLARLGPDDTVLVRARLRADVLKRFADSKEADDRWAADQYYATDPPLTPGTPGPTRGDLAAFEGLLRFRAREVSGDDAAADKLVAEAVAKAKTEPAAAEHVRKAPLQLALVTQAWPTLGEEGRQEIRDRWAADLRPLGLPVKLAAWQSPPARSREFDALDALRTLQQQHQAAAFTSNMLRLQHESRMTVIRNTGSSPYRTEYRYEYRRR